ncbi:ATP-binding cassette, subfamily B, MsbA [Nitrosomonas sp. PY1]|uniref:ABC transporter transmembrane domain-containing protein n=1 Tax=Nitrosomonas sp. PY1 TaxID=1803906 RepID=UPI001FC81BA1|nr:ABC transporter ATP-binding protein [Nitrosomonas sp. PY1]GKS70442.1 ATP-binding cassette, subfamily B, MsbA [Nitrosomonas sp. PY1]
MINLPPAYQRLAKRLTAQRALFAWLLLIFLINAIAIALLPIVIKFLFDNALILEDWVLVQKGLFAMLVLCLVRWIICYASSHLMHILTSRLGTAFYGEVFTKFLTLPASQYHRFIDHKKIDRLFHHIYQINLVTIEKLGLSIKESLTILGLFACLYYLHRDSLLLVSVLLPAVVLLYQIASDQLNKLSQENQKSFKNLAQLIVGPIQNYKEIKLGQGQVRENQRFEKAVASVFLGNRQKVLMQAVIRLAIEIILVGIVALSIYLFALQILHNQMYSGQVFAVTVAISMLSVSMHRMTRVFVDLIHDRRHLEFVFSFLDRVSEKDTGTLLVQPVRGKLQFEHITLNHTKQHNFTLNLAIQPSEKVVFTDYSEPVKNRLIDLLLRLEQPSSGRILLDGYLLNDIKIDNLYTNIALVSRNSLLLDETIAGSIAYGAMQCANEAQITLAMQTSGCNAFVKEMPDGLQTKVGDKGIEIGKVERLQIAIAHALLKNPAIIILDEVFDTDELNTEAALHALRTLIENRTTLVFSQTRSCWVDFDKMVLLDKESDKESLSYR